MGDQKPARPAHRADGGGPRKSDRAKRPIDSKNIANTSNFQGVAVFDGCRCLGHIINRGREGFEAFDRGDRSLGIFENVKAAAYLIGAEVRR
jgi:hypothetical protein